MRICIHCQKEYETSSQNCPWCGYPVGLNGFPPGVIADSLQGKYELIHMKNSVWTLWDGSKQQKVSCHPIPAGAAGDRIMEVLDVAKRCQSADPYPELMEICREGKKEGYYLTEYVGGISLQTILQRENPPSLSTADRLAAKLEILSNRLAKAPLHHGGLNLEILKETETGEILPAGYGSRVGITDREDRLQILRIMMRIYSGEWHFAEDIRKAEADAAHIRRGRIKAES